jgi:hypothetical protein
VVKLDQSLVSVNRTKDIVRYHCDIDVNVHTIEVPEVCGVQVLQCGSFDFRNVRK